MLNIFKKHGIFIMCFVVFLLFLARNPFSTRTLIPNFDPFPDATYYLNPALSLLQGHGLNMFREGRSLIPGVAPLYSLSLLPFFVMKPDPRMFYFANILFSLLSFFLFYCIVIKLLAIRSLSHTNHQSLTTNLQSPISNLLITFISLFLYITNFYLNWFPTLAMAENLQHLLFLFGIYLLLKPISKKNALFAGFIAVSFTLVKYASFPLTATYFILYILKYVLSSRQKSGSSLYISCAVFVATFFLVLSSYIYYDVTYKAGSFTNTFRGEATLLSKQIPAPAASGTAKITTPASGWFTFGRIPLRFSQYIKAYMGGPNAILWEGTQLMPSYIAFFSVLGLICALFIPSLFYLSFSLLSLLFAQTLFMSTYSVFDLRYAYTSIPTLLIGFALFWKVVLSSIRHPGLRSGTQKIIRNAILLMLFILFLFYTATHIISWKKTIMTNLKYAEVPWYYLSILKLNTDFPNTPKNNEKKPVVISSMLPYYIDFFSNKNYSLLPLDKSQDLMWFADVVWGKQDYSNLNKLYKNYINKGYPVYFFSYYKGNRFTDKEVKKDFNLTLVSEGCFKTCNLYKLSNKR